MNETEVNIERYGLPLTLIDEKDLVNQSQSSFNYFQNVK